MEDNNYNIKSNQDDSIIHIICETFQIDLSLFITNYEFDDLIIPTNHYYVSNDYHSFYHFPISTSNDSSFTSFDIFGSTFHYSDNCRVVEALQPSLMVIKSSMPQHDY